MPLVIASCVLFAASIAGCGGQDFVTERKNYFSMNTDAQLLVTYAQSDEAKVEELFSSVSSYLYAVEQSLSATITTSYIYKFNEASAGARVEIDEICYKALTLAKDAYDFTDGYYNPAVKLSVDAYKPFDKAEYTAGERELPSDETTSLFCELSSHFGELILEETDGRYYATKPNYTIEINGEVLSMQVDLGGIGKGLCVEEVSALIDEAGLEYGYFNFGSSGYAVKEYRSSDDGTYSMSLRDPRDDDETFCSFSIKDETLSTSGDYEQYFTIDGTRYCHIINPYTGKPIDTGVASATVIGGSAAKSDAYTTALSAMGKEKAVQFIKEKLTDETVILLITENGEKSIVTNAPDLVTAKDGFTVTGV